MNDGDVILDVPPLPGLAIHVGGFEGLDCAWIQVYWPALEAGNYQHVYVPFEQLKVLAEALLKLAKEAS